MEKSFIWFFKQKKIKIWYILHNNDGWKNIFYFVYDHGFSGKYYPNRACKTDEQKVNETIKTVRLHTKNCFWLSKQILILFLF